MTDNFTINIPENTRSIQARLAKDDWALLLMNKGILVRLFVKYWQGSERLTTEDLGMSFSTESGKAAYKENMYLGVKKIMPAQIAKELKKIVQEAKCCLKKHTYKTVWGYFMPYRAFASWEAENEKCKKKFELFVSRFMERHAEVIDIVKNEYRNIGTEAWKRLYPNSTTVSEAFLCEYIEKNISLIPRVEDIPSLFSYEVSFSIVPLPSIIQNEINKAAISEAETQIEIDAKRRISEIYISKKEDFINGFLDSTVNAMQNKISDACVHIMKFLSKNETNDINENHINKIREVIKHFRLINITDDVDIEKSLSVLANEMEKVKGVRDRNVLIVNLQKVVDTVKHSPFFEERNSIGIDFLDL